MKIKVFKLKEIQLLDGKIVSTGVNEIIEPKLPTYGKEGDACMDIYPIYCERDNCYDRFIYHTGLVFAIGENCIIGDTNENGDVLDYNKKLVPNEMVLRPRSNLTKSDFYMPNSPGTLDWGYRGELLIIFKNRTTNKLVESINLLCNGVETLVNNITINNKNKENVIRFDIKLAKISLNELSNSINTPPYNCDGKDRCAQLIIKSAERIIWEEVESIKELGETKRGNKGFGEGTGGAAKS